MQEFRHYLMPMVATFLPLVSLPFYPFTFLLLKAELCDHGLRREHGTMHDGKSLMPQKQCGISRKGQLSLPS